jgi:hypothetical protein
MQRQLSQPRCLGADGQVVAGTSSVVLTWSFEPQPDGTLRGTQTGTALTNECGVQGQVALAPVVATRVGDVPAGVGVADPATATVAPSTPAPGVAGPVLDGTYRLDFDLQNQTINGTVTGLATAVSEWWAFRSACTSAGCAAAGSQLAESNQQEGTGTTSVVNFADGHWQGTPTLQASMHCQRTNQAGHDDETRLWSWDPQADGTFRGLMIGTILSNGCGTQGTVYQTPFVATRTGDVAPSVIVADPGCSRTRPRPSPAARVERGPGLSRSKGLIHHRRRRPLRHRRLLRHPRLRQHPHRRLLRRRRPRVRNLCNRHHRAPGERAAVVAPGRTKWAPPAQPGRWTPTWRLQHRSRSPN